MNQLIQHPRFTQDEKQELKKLRQRAYDKRKQFKTYEESNEETDNDIEIQPSRIGTQSINTKQIITTIPIITFYSCIALATITLLWKQSIDLYASSGFSEPNLVALGSILMILGFASLHAVSKSKLALLLCIYSSGYEIAFMVSGTLKNESTIQIDQVEKNPQLVWLQDQIERTSSIYQTTKSKYENPDSKVFQNNWYKTKFVEPSWLEYSKAQKDLEAKKSEFTLEAKQDNHVGWLKIMYRLGLVFLAMLAVHLLLRNPIHKRRESLGLCKL